MLVSSLLHEVIYMTAIEHEEMPRGVSLPPSFYSFSCSYFADHGATFEAGADSS
jgi:hypothetical protein